MKKLNFIQRDGTNYVEVDDIIPLLRIELLDEFAEQHKKYIKSLDMKTCQKCGNEYENTDENFNICYNNDNRKEYLANTCKTCFKLYQKKYREAHKK